MPVRVEVLYFEGCSNWQVAASRVQAALAELGGEHQLQLREVRSPEEAEGMGLRGSPTVLVDGRDPFAGPDDQVGFSCRLFSTPLGPQGAPTLEQIRSVISQSGGGSAPEGSAG